MRKSHFLSNKKKKISRNCLTFFFYFCWTGRLEKIKLFVIVHGYIHRVPSIHLNDNVTFFGSFIFASGLKKNVCQCAGWRILLSFFLFYLYKKFFCGMSFFFVLFKLGFNCISFVKHNFILHCSDEKILLTPFKLLVWIIT